MGLRPQYSIRANSADITATVEDRLISLRLTDATGMDSDSLEIKLSDTDPGGPIALPSTGAELSVALGFDGMLRPMGVFVVDEIEMSGWPSEMTIKAKAAPQDKTPAGKKSLRSQKTRRWKEGTTLGEVVKTIAADHGMAPKISANLASKKLPDTHQTDESDLHFLVRLARRFDATVKPANGALLVVKIGEGLSADGQALPTIPIVPGDVISYRASIQMREVAKKCIAYWHDVKGAKRKEETAGEGEPEIRLKGHYKTSDQAKEAAATELRKRQRGKGSVTVTMPGRPDIFAEAKMALAGFRPGVDGTWLIKSVEHSFAPSSGYTTTVEGEFPNGG